METGMNQTSGNNRCLTIKTKTEMKKNLFMVAAVALMTFTACNKEEIAGGNEIQTPTENPTEAPAEEASPVAVVEFTASLGETKTTLDASGKKTLWLASDEISINGEVFVIKELIEDGAYAKFVNKAELPSDFAAPYVAYYPANVTAVPATQNAYAGNFDPTAVVEKAESDTHELSFENVASLLKFEVEQKCTTLTISSDDALAGDSKTITVNGPFETGKTYYAAVEPGKKANFVVRMDGYLSKNDASVTIGESTIANMKLLPAPVKASWGIFGLQGDWSEGYDMFNDLDGYSVAKGVEIKSTDEFKFWKNQSWSNGELAGGITAPDTKRDGGWVNITVSQEGTYDVYTNGTNYYIMTPGKFPTEAGKPGDIEITVTYDGDTNRNYIHVWSDGGEVANNKVCTSQNPFTWKIKIPAGDQQKRDYQFILKKGNGWNSYQTANSDKMCLRNPMPLKIVNNKPTHK